MMPAESIQNVQLQELRGFIFPCQDVLNMLFSLILCANKQKPDS